MSERIRTRNRLNAERAVVFVAHVQTHLDLGQYTASTEGRKIPPGLVGCKICEKSIDQIFEEEA